MALRLNATSASRRTDWAGYICGYQVGTTMRRSGRKENLHCYIESAKDRQRNLTWPELLRNGRFVDEFLWKGARDALLVQRIGAVVLALAYVLIGLTFVSLAIELQRWSEAIFAGLLFLAGGWFIRNALRK
jgi:hypothetical protein